MQLVICLSMTRREISVLYRERRSNRGLKNDFIANNDRFRNSTFVTEITLNKPLDFKMLKK